MEKLDYYIQIETNKGFRIEKAFSPYHGPGIANYEENCVVLNQRFLMGHIESFNENDLIGVLYHEIGHLKYIKLHPVVELKLTEDFKVNSEYYAFEYSLIVLLEIANNGDFDPLKAMFNKISDRIRKVQENNFEDEDNSQSHINALLKISDSEIFAKCSSYLSLLSARFCKACPAPNQ